MGIENSSPTEVTVAIVADGENAAQAIVPSCAADEIRASVTGPWEVRVDDGVVYDSIHDGGDSVVIVIEVDSSGAVNVDADPESRPRVDGC